MHVRIIYPLSRLASIAKSEVTWYIWGKIRAVFSPTTFVIVASEDAKVAGATSAVVTLSVTFTVVALSVIFAVVLVAIVDVDVDVVDVVVDVVVVKHSGHPMQSGAQLHLTLQRCLYLVQNSWQYFVGGLIVAMVRTEFCGAE